jgi:hypothetical protein
LVSHSAGSDETEFWNRLLRRIFGHKKEELTKNMKKLNNEKLRYLKCSLNIIRVVKSRWMGRVEYASRMGEI